MRIWVKSSVALWVVTATGYLLDRLLRHEGVPRRDLLLLSDLLVGIVAALLMSVLAVREEQRNRFIASRLKVIADMNHHIRNALQIISFHSHWEKNKEVVAIDEAVKRIIWVLHEVLPQLPDPGNDSAIREKANTQSESGTGISRIDGQCNLDSDNQNS